MAAAGRRLDLPVVDLASPDPRAAAKSIRQACVEYGFFYVINHGIEPALLEEVFANSWKFFEQTMEEKMALQKNDSHRGYTWPYSEKVDNSPESRGDSKETFYIGSMDDNINQWPSEGDVSGPDNKDIIGAAAHSDYGMLALLATDGTLGLQICREKDRDPHIWEDVHHIDGSLIVNIGDLLERWTNCVFRSTLHRVIPVGRERYSVAFFIDPSPNLVVKCMESCCSEAYPARFAPVKSGDYIKERLSSVYNQAIKYST